MPILEVKDLSYIYGVGTPFKKEALKNVNAAFEKGELVSVIGHTGSGKSTLLMHLNGLLKPTSGTVLLNGKDIWESKQSVKNARFNVGFCFQYPEHQLFEATVEEDIAFGPKNMGLSQAEIEQRVKEAAEYAGVHPSLLKKSPFDLSGGEKRRAAIAGVMAMRPSVLILDEPTAGLDPRGRKAVVELVSDYNRSTGSTVIFVSHNMDDVSKIADRVLVMNDGRVEMFGAAREVFSQSTRLRELGLDVPEVTGMLLRLREEGFDVGTDIYDVGGAEKELLSLLRRCCTW